jgi:hypothetical protein
VRLRDQLQMISPFFSQLADKHGDKIVFLKVDVDVCEEVAGKICNITAMPTFQVSGMSAHTVWHQESESSQLARPVRETARCWRCASVGLCLSDPTNQPTNQPTW